MWTYGTAKNVALTKMNVQQVHVTGLFPMMQKVS
jgi:hypothetical protein